MTEAETGPLPAVGRSTLTQRHVGRAGTIQRSILDAAWAAEPLQLEGDARTGLDDDSIRAAAGHGVSGPGAPLPYLDQLQDAFGEHDVSGVRAHFGSQSRDANVALGANAYATGNDVAFGDDSPSLHLVAHEAAHVVQQRAGVHLSSSVGQAGDSYEQHADAVADRVVRGESAAELLGSVAGGPPVARDVQRKASPKPNPDPRSQDPYLPHMPKISVSAIDPQVGKTSTLTVVDLAGEASEKKAAKGAVYEWKISGDPSAWKTMPSVPHGAVREDLKLEPKARVRTMFRVELLRTTPVGNQLTAVEPVWVSIKDATGQEMPDWGKQDTKTPEVAAVALKGLTEYLKTGATPEIHPQYRYLYDTWRDAKLGSEKGGKSKWGDGRRTLDGTKWQAKIEGARINTGDVYERANTADPSVTAAYDTQVQGLLAEATERTDYEAREAQLERQGAVKKSIEASGFDGFCGACGSVVEALVPANGQSAKLVVRGNFPLQLPGTVMFLALSLECENDSQYKFRGELNGGIAVTADFWIVEAFAQAKVFGYYEASGDTGTELFTMVKVAIVDGLYRHLKGQYGDKKAKQLAYKVFAKEEVEAVCGAMDNDDYVEVGTGYELSAGMASNKDKTPKNFAATGKFEQSDARKLTGNGASFEGIDVEREKYVFEGSYEHGTLELGLTCAKEGKDSLVEAVIRGGLKLDLKDLADDQWRVAITTSIFGAFAGVIEKIVDGQHPLRVVGEMFRKPVAAGAIKLSPKVKGKPFEGKLAAKLGLKLGWTNGAFGGGDVTIATSEAYSLGEEQKAGGYIGYEAEEKLVSWKLG